MNNNNAAYRLIDANANRLKEGLRVLEDISRFIAGEKRLTAEFKKIRHLVTEYMLHNTGVSPLEALSQRQVRFDVGKKSIESELKRTDVLEIFSANLQRVKESIRVLEEFFKLYDRKTALCFKKLRYRIYSLEKSSIEKVLNLCHNKSVRR
ncbi:MAG: thiamine-phosphate pyrophosphorylase [Candidatus Omnitrophica bacterium]|nr:thiamine-phosphate pyrophosphorylase [Candidatus Omnitrophota bacterium]